MNHPSHEDWMAYLYDEMEPGAREAAETHLHSCPACREAVARWRNTMSALDGDEVHAPTRRVRPWTQAVPWAAAAGVALSLGFFGGRLTGASRGELANRLAQTRQEILRESGAQRQADLQLAATEGARAAATESQRMLADVAKAFGEARKEDRRVLLATLQQLEDQQAQFAGLKQGVVSLARWTGSGFRQTESQLNLLASTSPAGSTELPATGQPTNTTNDEK